VNPKGETKATHEVEESNRLGEWTTNHELKKFSRKRYWRNQKRTVQKKKAKKK